MSSEPVPAQPSRPWRMLLPLSLVIGLALAWCGYWFVAASFAESEIDRLIEREAQNGREITCTDRQFSGFPFRFVVTCKTTGIVITRPGQIITVSSEGSRAIAQAYNPFHIIAEFDGPLDMRRQIPGEADTSVRLNWESALASVRVGQVDKIRASLSAENVLIWPKADRSSIAAPAPVEIKTYEGHIRPHTAGEGAGPLPDFDFFAIGREISHPHPAPDQDRATIAEASITGAMLDVPVSHIHNRDAFLRAWQRAGGKLVLDRVWIDRPETATLVAGELMLTASARPQGNLQVDFFDLDELIRQLDQTIEGDAGSMIGFFMRTIRNIATPSTTDGKPTRRLNLEFDDGLIKVQGNPIARTQPLFEVPSSQPQ